MQWGDAHDTCAVEQGKRTDCDFRDGTTSDHVCTCAPAGTVLPAAGMGVVLHGGAAAAAAGGRVAGSGETNVLVWNSTLALAGGRVAAGSKAGLVAAAGSGLQLDGTVVEGHALAGVSLHSGSRAALRGAVVRANGGDGAAVDGGSRLEADGSNFSDNGLRGVYVGGGSLAGLRGGGAAGNGQAGLLVEDGSAADCSGAALTDNGDAGVVLRNGSEAALADCVVARNSALRRSPSLGGGAFVTGNSTLRAMRTAFSTNLAGLEGGGVYFDGSSGGGLELRRCTVANNSARAFGGGLRAVNAAPLVATLLRSAPGSPDFYLLPASNGTHLFAFTADYVLRALALAPGPGQSRLTAIAGTAGVSGLQDGWQGSADPAQMPQFQDYQMRGALSADGARLFTTAVLSNYRASFSPIRVVELALGAVWTLRAVDAELNSTLADQGWAVSCLQPDPTGSFLYIGHRAALRAVDLNSGRVSTLAGRIGEPGVRDGVGTSARFVGPEALALVRSADSEGWRIYLIDYSHDGQFSSVRWVDTATLAVGTVVSDRGKETGFATLVDGPRDVATLGDVWSLAASDDGVLLYVMSYTYACVRTVSALTGFVRTCVSQCSLTGSGDAGGGALEARLSIPEMLLLVGGRLYMHDKGNRKIKFLADSHPIAVLESRFEGNTAAYGGGMSLAQVLDAEIKYTSILRNSALTGVRSFSY